MFLQWKFANTCFLILIFYVAFLKNKKQGYFKVIIRFLLLFSLQKSFK